MVSTPSFAAAAGTALLALAASAPSVGAVTYRPNLWGFATSAYQIEGAWDTDGRGPTIWDDFVHQNNSQIAGGATADVAADHYHKYSSDIDILKSTGSNAYRFSIQWPRIYPDGSGTVNQDGLNFYSDLIDAIIAAGNEPVATLFHWDLPSALQSSYGGVADAQFVTDFENYAKTVIDTFGDRVKYWLTFNEPASFCKNGYLTGSWPPSHLDGNAGMYLCGHNIILAHTKAVNYLLSKYPKSEASFAYNTNWWVPLTDSDDDKTAAENAIIGTLGWFVDPFFTGDYPTVMRNDATIGSLLPTFTDDEKTAMKTALTFIGYNYYTSEYAYSDSSQPMGFATTVYNNSGEAIGPVAGTGWLYIYPTGMRSIAKWIHERYNGTSIWITENGVSVPNEPTMTAAEVKNDTFRQNFFHEHLAQLDLLINTDKIAIQAYLVWSLLDNFEWKSGYQERFGVVGVDYTNGTLDRNEKDSLGTIRSFFAARTAVNASDIISGNGSSNTDDDSKHNSAATTRVSVAAGLLAVVPAALYLFAY